MKAADLIADLANRYYVEGDDSVLPLSIATRAAFLNSMSLDIAMGGSTNTVLHLLAPGPSNRLIVIYKHISLKGADDTF